MRVELFVCLWYFPGAFFHSRVTAACPVTTDLIARTNVRTATHHHHQCSSMLYVCRTLSFTYSSAVVLIPGSSFCCVSDTSHTPLRRTEQPGMLCDAVRARLGSRHSVLTLNCFPLKSRTSSFALTATKLLLVRFSGEHWA